MCVVEIAARQEFSANYQRVVDIGTETYQNLRADEPQLDRKMAKKEMAYYATSMLWLKLLEVKAKDWDISLTTQEKAIRKAVADDHFNVPQPLFAYLTELGTGTYTDKMGKETRHQVPPLPTTVVQGFGGYHANEITSETHNLFFRYRWGHGDGFSFTRI